ELSFFANWDVAKPAEQFGQDPGIACRAEPAPQRARAAIEPSSWAIRQPMPEDLQRGLQTPRRHAQIVDRLAVSPAQHAPPRLEDVATAPCDDHPGPFHGRRQLDRPTLAAWTFRPSHARIIQDLLRLACPAGASLTGNCPFVTRLSHRQRGVLGLYSCLPHTRKRECRGADDCSAVAG